MTQSETEFQKQAIELLLWNKYLVIRINSGRKGNISFYRICNTKETSGLSDLIAIRHGKISFIELKKKKGKASEGQKEFLKLAKSFGAKAETIDNIEDLNNFINNGI